MGHLLAGLRPGPVGDKRLGGCRIAPSADERQMALGQPCDFAPAVRLIRTPQELKGDRLDQGEAGNPRGEAPRGAQSDRAAIGVSDQMYWPSGNIQQSLEDSELSIRCERRIA